MLMVDQIEKAVIEAIIEKHGPKAGNDFYLDPRIARMVAPTASAAALEALAADGDVVVKRGGVVVPVEEYKDG